MVVKDGKQILASSSDIIEPPLNPRKHLIKSHNIHWNPLKSHQNPLTSHENPIISLKIPLNLIKIPYWFPLKPHWTPLNPIKIDITHANHTYLHAMDAPSAPWAVITGGGSGIGRGTGGCHVGSSEVCWFLRHLYGIYLGFNLYDMIFMDLNLNHQIIGI